MYRVYEKNMVKVFANTKEQLVPVSSKYDATNKKLTLTYNITNPSAITVSLDTQNSFMQAVFQCDDETICIVNARDRRAPIMFDGFVNERSDDDECKTRVFCVGNLKELDYEHGLCVREMVRVMESPTILRIYVNEAVISSSSSLNLNANLVYENEGADFDRLIKELKVNNVAVTPQRRRLSKRINETRWAPVSCKTGRHLLTAIITFNNCTSKI